MTERWLLATLSLTFVALGVACGLTGGARSPLLPLLFAPVGVAFGAFGAAPGVTLAATAAALAVAGLALIPASSTLPP
ncbi:MAG: hypothetical protein FJ104_11595, partial [Deltaproteobacteria bacterium]|nr:hypothetical protein [Deltaproteobacteria bacterium]